MGERKPERSIRITVGDPSEAREQPRQRVGWWPQRRIQRGFPLSGTNRSGDTWVLGDGGNRVHVKFYLMNLKKQNEATLLPPLKAWMEKAEGMPCNPLSHPTPSLSREYESLYRSHIWIPSRWCLATEVPECDISDDITAAVPYNLRVRATLSSQSSAWSILQHPFNQNSSKAHLSLHYTSTSLPCRKHF